MTKHDYELLAQKATRWLGSPRSIVVHTVFFALCFATVVFGGVAFDKMLLVLTTIVSLEAIYLSLFIQMSVNMANESIDEVEKDIDEIQKDVDDIQEDVGEIQTDVDEIQKDIDDVQENVEDIAEDIDDVQEGVEEISQGDKKIQKREDKEAIVIQDMYKTLQRLLKDVQKLDERTRKK